MNKPSSAGLLRRLSLTAGVALLVVGCAESPTRYDVPPPRVAKSPVSTSTQASAGVDTEGEVRPDDGVTGEVASSRTGTQRLAPPPRSRASMQTLDWSGRFPDNDSVTAAVEGMPLRDFVNYAFSDVLKASYVIAEGLPGLDDPITLNLERPISSRAFYRLLAEMLDSRKVATTFRDNVFFLTPADGKARGLIPIGLGRRPQDVPNVPGTIMQVVPLRYGLNLNIERTIVDLVSVQVKPDPSQSALFITGEREQLLRALDVVGLLDQPANRAREVAIVNLSYVGSKELSEQLVTLLENEGIQAGLARGEGKNVSLVPLTQLGAIVIFAGAPELLQRVEYWIKQLDQPHQGPDERYFIYHPRHSRASDLGESLAPLLGGQGLPAIGNRARDTRSALGGTNAFEAGTVRSVVTPEDNVVQQRSDGQFVTQDNVLRRDTRAGTTSGTTPISVRGEGVTLSVDPRSNSLIFYTTGDRYQALLPMVRRLDVPPKQVLLEATIAEVTMTGEFAYGVEFAFSSGEFSGGTLGNLGLPDGGFALNWIGSVTDQVRLKLSATNGLVNVLSNPTLVVRDGVEASISVGNDVPTIGATASDPIVSDTQITQILYRKTGLELRIRPTINAQGLVVMEIDQSISNTVAGASAVAGAPTFFERKVSTEVVARSGQSILLAGLISDRQNDTTSRVPGISQIPGLGWLFRSDSKSNEKTELVVLITPRVIDDPGEWGQIRVGMQDAFEHLRLPPERAVTAATAAAPACSDLDGDSVCDAGDDCGFTLAGATVNASGCEVGEFEVPGLTFSAGVAALSLADEAALNPLVALLRERQDLLAEIRGHADRNGTESTNAELSRQRAEAVRAYLVRRGIAVERLSAVGLGENAPLASESTEAGRARNRRVSVFLQPASNPLSGQWNR